ncbi:hypothetical protein CDAR_464081 [Caerostris darwini]|uniref:Uncharacterized protein n=1 Tax=Caerostris darwini TaxID=1538125 RepID=A0AAV4VTH2_9ARAC|nr:hypothetical protein CDAR_464081 [Caerostris darwini]
MERVPYLNVSVLPRAKSKRKRVSLFNCPDVSDGEWRLPQNREDTDLRLWNQSRSPVSRRKNLGRRKI